MKHTPSSLLLRTAALATLGAAVLIGGAAQATAQESSTGENAVVAQGVDTQLSQPITDEVGILSADDEREITKAIDRLQDDKQLTLRVVYVNSFEGQTPQQYTQQAVADSGGYNIGVFAVAVDERQYGLYGGSAWPTSVLDSFDKGALGALQDDDFAGAPVAGIDAVVGPSGGAITAGGVAAVVVIGGGAWWFARRAAKKRSRVALAQSRELDPSDTRAIAALPVATLATRAEEVIVETDDSVRNAREQLQVVTDEFGPDRTRPFLKAFNTSNSALQKAHHIRARLSDSIPESEQEKRTLYTEIISSCGQAQRALDEQSETFAELRNLLINASSALDTITQRTVDLRTRMDPASATLKSLRAEYSPEILSSIDDNVHLAAAALNEAEKALVDARKLEHEPAGRQGGLIDLIHESERAVHLADSLLTGIEHADSNIASARQQLPALIDEVEAEITEAGQLKDRGINEGADVDWSSLDAAVANAQDELRHANETRANDPLRAYNQLMDADSQLDDALDLARSGTQDQARKLAVFDQQLASTQSQIQSAEDLISSRGRIIGTEARTHLAEAQRMAAQAQHLRTRDTRQANELARGASMAAKRAAAAAKNDIDIYRNRNNYRRNSGMANAAAGMMILDALLSGGGGGFRGGGGGGGGFRGGGF